MFLLFKEINHIYKLCLFLYFFEGHALFYFSD